MGSYARLRHLSVAFAVLVSLAGCSSASSVPAVPSASAPVAAANTGTASAILSIGLHVTPASPVIGVTVSAAPVDGSSAAVTASGPCANGGCTISVGLPPSYDTLTVSLTDASGRAILTGAFNADAGSIDGTTTAIAFGGDPATATLSIDPPDFTVGTPSTAQLTLVAKDARGRRIIGSTPFTTPVAVTSSGSAALTFAAAPFTSPASTIQLSYNGAASSPVTLTSSTVTTQAADIGFVGAATVTSFGEASGDERRPSAEELDMVPSASVNPTPLPGLQTMATSAVVDLSANFPPIGDQGTQQSCTAWSSTYSIRTYLDEVRNHGTLTGSLAPLGINPDLVYSPAFIFNSLNGGQNVGINGLKAMRFLKYQGAVSWTTMPWSVAGVTPPPNASQLQIGLQHRIAHYHTIRADANAMSTVKKYLAAGVPVFWAVDIDSNLKLLYTSLHGAAAIWSSQGTGPERHAMLLVGYDDTKQLFKFRNSWGTQFGDNGYGYVTYSFWPQIHGAEMFVEEP
jgi:hypothetical protein